MNTPQGSNTAMYSELYALALEVRIGRMLSPSRSHVTRSGEDHAAMVALRHPQHDPAGTFWCCWQGRSPPAPA